MNIELEHHGVKGMHWGIRRTPEQLGRKKTKTKETDEYGLTLKDRRAIDRAHAKAANNKYHAEDKYRHAIEAAQIAKDPGYKKRIRKAAETTGAIEYEAGDYYMQQAKKYVDKISKKYPNVKVGDTYTDDHIMSLRESAGKNYVQKQRGRYVSEVLLTSGTPANIRNWSHVTTYNDHIDRYNQGVGRVNVYIPPSMGVPKYKLKK